MSLLKEYKEIYRKQAVCIEDWKKLSLSDLFFQYLVNKDINEGLADKYFSGIMYYAISKCICYMNSQTPKIVTEEDCYDIAVRSIMYVLDKRIWENKDSYLYNVRVAPEMAMNVKMNSEFKNCFKSKRRDKRNANNEVISLEELNEIYPDDYFLVYKDSNKDALIQIKSMIQKYFSDGEYVSAYVIDSIINKSVFNSKRNNEFSINKLRISIKNIDKGYCKRFSDMYNLDRTKVESTIEYINNLSSTELNSKIQNLFKTLRRNKDFYLSLKNGWTY